MIFSKGKSYKQKKNNLNEIRDKILVAIVIDYRNTAVMYENLQRRACCTIYQWD